MTATPPQKRYGKIREFSSDTGQAIWDEMKRTSPDLVLASGLKAIIDSIALTIDEQIVGWI